MEWLEERGGVERWWVWILDDLKSFLRKDQEDEMAFWGLREGLESSEESLRLFGWRWGLVVAAAAAVEVIVKQLRWKRRRKKERNLLKNDDMVAISA